MYPTIAPGARVEVTLGSDLRAGDLAAFIGGRRLVVHRVHLVADQHYWIQGDGQRGDLERVPRRAVMGRVLRILHASGAVTLRDTPLQRLQDRLWVFTPGAMQLMGRAVRLLQRKVRHQPTG